MNIVKTVHISIANVIVLLLLIISSCSSDNNSQDGTNLNILSINLLFSELSDRSARLEDIANFVKQKNDISDPVDIILLQEVVGGILSGTSNSSMDLVNMLSDRGLIYHIYYRLSNGLPALFQEGNAILSRHELLSTDYEKLPVVSEDINADFQITLRQEIIMATINIAGYGEISVYNTHLCAYCDPAGRLEQTQAAMDFIDNTEVLTSNNNPIILGGDFNIDLNFNDDQSSYNIVTSENSYIDTYTFMNGCVICCSTDFGYSGCTYAIPGNTYATALFPGQPIDISRIDYIFLKGAETISSNIVFNDYPWVSDHSGVLTKIKLN